MRRLNTFMKTRQGNGPHHMSQCLIIETEQKDGELYWNWERQEVEKVLPENTITANIHVRRMKKTELCIFLQSDPRVLLGVVSLLPLQHCPLRFSFLPLIWLIFKSPLLFDFKSCSRLQHQHWQISPAECDPPSSGTTAHSGTNNSSRGRGGYFLLSHYWPEGLSVSHEQS